MKEFLLFVVMFLSFGCVSIPKETVLLSENLGEGINNTEEAHMALVKLFFQEKREEVDYIINELWVPTFANEFFNIPEVKDKWNDVCSSQDDDEKLKFTTFVGNALQKRINEKRRELIDPLDKIEKSLTLKLIENYASLKTSNLVLTNYLVSASNLKESKIKVLEMLGVNQNKLNNTISGIYTLMENVNDNVDKIKSTTGLEDYKNNLEILNNAINNSQNE